MNILQTELSINHIELIKIFFEANDMLDVIVTDYSSQVGTFYHKLIELRYDNEDTIHKLTFMGLRHAGVRNMLDDYLLKCGVPVDELQPTSIHRQHQAEKEHIRNEEFMRHLEAKIKTTSKATSS